MTGLRALLSLMVTLLALVSLQDSHWSSCMAVEARSMRNKPPFNGSIFGKRSMGPSAPTLEDLLQQQQQPTVSASSDEIENQFVKTILQQCLAVFSATNQVSNSQTTSRQLSLRESAALANLCELILEDVRRTAASTEVQQSWFGRLID